MVEWLWCESDTGTAKSSALAAAEKIASGASTRYHIHHLTFIL